MSAKLSHRAFLALNVLLAGTVVALALHRLNRASAPAAGEISASEIMDDAGPPTRTKESPAFARPSKLPPFADLGSAADRRRLIVDQLRAMGVPNEVLGRVARVDFEVEWDSRFDECRGDMDKLAAVQLEMNLSKDTQMRTALGEEDFKQWDQSYMLWEAMSTPVDVTASEAEALYAFKKKLQQRMLELDQSRLKGTMDEAEINEATDKAYAEFYRKMKTLLGAERYARSQQMDDAFVANNFRHQVAKANPTDAQFRELFKVEQDWNRARMEVEQQFQNDTFSPDYLEKLKALDAARDQNYQRVLGADVFDALQKQQDPAYSKMKKFESLWGLDDRKIDYAYTAMKQYQKSVDEYQARVLTLQSSGQGVDGDEVSRNLRQLAEQTQLALREQLGQESFNRLQRNRVLRWATLASGPAPPP